MKPGARFIAGHYLAARLSDRAGSNIPEKAGRVRLAAFQRSLSPKERDVDLARLRLRVSYDPQTGKMTWTEYGRHVGKEIGWVNPAGYRVVCFSHRGPVMLHRLIWFYVHGRWPVEFLDHINGDRGDNRLLNLREVTSRQNCLNSAAKRGVPLKGITKTKHGRWQAQIRIGGKNTYLGTYATAEEAGAIYAAKAKECFGEFVRRA